MQILNKTGINLVFNEIEGCIDSLKYEDKEYVGAKLPIFEIAFRNESGDLEVLDAFSFSLINKGNAFSGCFPHFLNLFSS